MPRVLSGPAFRAMFSQETGEVFLICLTLTHANWPNPVYVVYNNQPITRTIASVPTVFLPALFEINLPEEVADKIPEVRITIDNVDRSIIDLIALITGTRVQVVLEVVLASSPDTVEAGPFTFWMLSATYDAQKITGVLGYEDTVLNSEFPKLKYTPVNSHGLFG